MLSSWLLVTSKVGENAAKCVRTNEKKEGKRQKEGQSCPTGYLEAHKTSLAAVSPTSDADRDIRTIGARQNLLSNGSTLVKVGGSGVAGSWAV